MSEFSEEQENILSKAIETHGIEKQLDMLTEEVGELLTAINKLKRASTGVIVFGDLPSKSTSVKYSLTYYGLCSEIADVKIMLKQMELVFDREAIQISVDRKLERLSNRLTKKEY